MSVPSPVGSQRIAKGNYTENDIGGRYERIRSPCGRDSKEHSEKGLRFCSMVGVITTKPSEPRAYNIADPMGCPILSSLLYGIVVPHTAIGGSY